jgi:tetratricopeptide (TPR) repeat protein
LWVLALMQRNYDKFFDIANNFTSEDHKLFVSKLQWYKDQISKQMWMPDYYFDTLVWLELFNQWLFQPAKVLALYSLQQNSSYILPYQILAYSNFLTNSRDTSIEYLKKLVDLDPNSADKYQFLMWVAYYRNEKYEQSVIMLSLVKDEKLRLDSERYLIRNYLLLNQNNKVIASRNKLLWYENLVPSDFYTYFYETFYRPYSEWSQYQLYAIDTDLADKMIRVCAIRLSNEDISVCNYGSIGKNIALWKFDWLEQSLLQLATQYPQWYLYHALWEYYLQQNDIEKAKVYLLKAISLTQKGVEKAQIKELLQSII